MGVDDGAVVGAVEAGEDAAAVAEVCDACASPKIACLIRSKMLMSVLHYRLLSSNV
jgi:hypothetical protein